MIPELEKIWEHLCVCIKVKRCSDGVLTQKKAVAYRKWYRNSLIIVD